MQINRPLRHIGALALLLCATNVRADDGAMYGKGGNLRMMRGHPTVRMVAEYVYIRLPEAIVTAKFVFHNDGPATTVTMGFPEYSGGTDVTYRSKPYFKWFRCKIDGKRVRVKRHSSKSDYKYDEYTAWWVKKVHFAKGQTRVVVDSYCGDLGGESTGETFFEYTLDSGNSWKGTIGSARIIVDVHGLRRENLKHVTPKGFIHRGNAIKWYFTNLAPQDNIRVSWITREMMKQLLYNRTHY